MSQRPPSKALLILSDEEAFRTEITLRINEFAAMSHQFLTGPLSDVFEYSELDQPSAVLIDLTNYEPQHLSTLQKICAHFDHSRLVGIGNFKEVDAVIKLIKLGIKDFLKFPLEAKEVQAFSNQLKSVPLPSTPVKLGRIITIFSPKGGTGVTLLATNLGANLAQQRPAERIAICDLSPQAGDVVTYLDLTATYTLRDLIDNTPRLDLSFLDGVMLSHSSGVKILASPREDQEPLNSGCLTELQSVFSLARQAYDILLIDAGHTDDTLLQLALMQSDLILLVGNSDLPSLKGLVFALSKLTQLNYDPNKIKVIINRFDAKNQLDTKEFEKKTKHAVACHLPNQYSICIEAINNGIPLSKVQKNSNLAQKIQELAEMIRKAVTTNGVWQTAASPSSRVMGSSLAAAAHKGNKGFIRWGS